MLEDISEENIASRVQGNPEHLDEDPEQVTPPLKIKRTTRVSRPTQRYFPSLYYLLLTDGGEPEYYASGRFCQVGVSHERGDEFPREESDLGVDEVTGRKESLTEQMGVPCQGRA